MIYIANNEKQYVHDAFIKNCGKHMINIGYLAVGDIVVNNYVIERKQINDLYASVLDGRLFKQMENMSEFIEKNPDTIGILLIEGRKLSKHLRQYKKMFSMNEITVNVIVKYGVIPLFTENLQHTINLVNEFANYPNKYKHVIKAVRAYKTKSTLQQTKKYVLMGFPTIGERRANKILEEYDTLMEYFKNVSEGKNNKVKEVLTQ